MNGQAFSHYRIRDQLGSGGMGVVYRAEDLTLRRDVAVKFLPADAASDRRMLDRFLREARATAALNHPNICTIYEAGEQDGQAYIVMELLEGRTLEQYLVAEHPGVARLLDMAAQIAAGLGAAHDKGIIHRDIKPANIFIVHDGRVKILDFGIAKLRAGLDLVGPGADPSATTFAEAAQLTEDGSLVGTIAYMSPEQARAEALDPRSDLFSFGAVLYEMCTGRRPFHGSTWAVIANGILSEAPTPPSTLAPAIPPELDAIVLKCLEKNRERRYHDAAEIRADLRSVARDVEFGGASETRVAIVPTAGTAAGDLRPPSGAHPTTVSVIRDYLQRFGDFGGQPLSAHQYVWPAVSVQDVSTGEELSTEHGSELLGRILEEDSNAFVLLLGDYGSGKTSFMRMWGNALAAEALGGNADAPIPIYLSLAYAQGKPDLLEAMSAYLGRYGVSLSATQLKDLLLSRRPVVLLLDGFDEMASGVDYRSVPEILEKIHGLQLTAGVRIILSGRSSFFRSEIEVGIVRASYVVRLKPFDSDSMLTYVSRRDPGLTSRAAALFEKHANLRELCRNPIHLMLFVNWLRAADSPLQRLATGGARRTDAAAATAPEDISVVDLYQRFFTKTLQHNFGSITTWPLDQRWEFVRRLAWDWFKEGNAEWPMRDFSRRIAAELPELSRGEVETYTVQLLNCTFFTRVGDRFRFLHQSYLEYLVSEALSMALSSGDLVMWDTPLYTDIYEMTYRLLVARGFEKIPIEAILQNGTVRAQANFLAMSFRHRPAAMEHHLRKQLRQNPHDIVRFLAAMGIGLYEGSPENLECVVAAFASESNTIIKAMIQRVASNWLGATSAPELSRPLQAVAASDVPLRTEDAARVMLQDIGTPQDAERALFAFRRAMIQGDQLWTAAAGGILSLGAVGHASSFSYIVSTASQARHAEIRRAYQLVQPLARLPELPAE